MKVFVIAAVLLPRTNLSDVRRQCSALSPDIWDWVYFLPCFLCLALQFFAAHISVVGRNTLVHAVDSRTVAFWGYYQREYPRSYCGYAKKFLSSRTSTGISPCIQGL